MLSATLENIVLAFEIAFLSVRRAKLLLLPVSGAILDYTKIQLVLGVGRRSVVLATLDNVVLASEIAFLPVIQAKLLLLPVSGGHVGFHQDAAGARCRSTFCCVGNP
jgi:hypothetical protein